MFVQMGVNEVAMRVGTPNKLQTALRESELIPEKLIMPMKGRDWQECCVRINGAPSLSSGLDDKLRTLARSNVLTTPDRFFSELSERT